ncbi:MAG TPA: hypothetical protein VH114_03495 [Candidatus Acidoferrum sp.]|jgi:hypothetical protein|nr:hypothetical protein [Candidatus Acidoferrum sp.]
MRQLLLIAIAIAFLAMGSGISSGQTSPTKAEIRVLLLNYKTGRPLKGRYVELVLSGPDGKYSFRGGNVRGKSDADGVAVFMFEKLPPARVWVLPLDDYECAADVEFSTADILQHGIAAKYVDDSRCKPHASSLPDPKPGEVVFPVHRLNLGQRFWRGLE